MDSTAEHIIQKLSVELTLQSPDQGHELQETVSRLIRQQLEPALDELFTGLSGEPHIVIDRLEIDLDSLSASSLEEEFLAMVNEQVWRQLSDQIRSAQPENERFSSSSKGAEGIKEISIEALFHYLRTGTYPWYVTQKMKEGALESPESVFHQLLKSSEHELKKRLWEELSASQVRHRIAVQFGDESIRKIVILIAPSLKSAFDELMKVLQTLIAHHIAEFKISRVKECLLKTIYRYQQQSLPEEVGRNIFFQLLEETGGAPGKSYRKILRELNRRNIESIERELPDSGLGKFLLQQMNTERLLDFLTRSDGRLFMIEENELSASQSWIEELRSKAAGTQLEQSVENLLDEFIISGEEETFTAPASVISKMKRELEEHLLFEVTEKSRNDEKAGAESPQKEKSKEFFITNTGLILLWPYLIRFFRKLELIVDKDFINEEAKIRAVHLLQFLVTGSEKTREYRMVLNKVLSGYDLEAPLPAGFEITDSEREEAEELIQSAIDHWKVLKNTSIEVFREAFLNRNGKLSYDGNQWMLQVESQSFDMLLDRLPWGISIVKLPWMPDPLHVEWR